MLWSIAGLLYFSGLSWKQTMPSFWLILAKISPSSICIKKDTTEAGFRLERALPGLVIFVLFGYYFQPRQNTLPYEGHIFLPPEAPIIALDLPCLVATVLKRSEKKKHSQMERLNKLSLLLSLSLQSHLWSGICKIMRIFTRKGGLPFARQWMANKKQFKSFFSAGAPLSLGRGGGASP